MTIAGKEKAEARLACDSEAIRREDRPRYHALVAKIFGAVAAREGLANGHCFRFVEGGVDLAEVGEWMDLERRCCGFLSFRLEVDEEVRLTLRGPEGVKAILATGLGGRAYESV